MQKILVVTAITASIFTFGCSQETSKPNVKREDAQITSASASQELSAIKAKVDELETKVFLLENAKDEYKTTFFDTTGSTGYQRVDANIGTFLVTLDKVEPYLDGQKVTLLVGNPNSVTFTGLEIKASWSARMPDFKLPSEERKKAWATYTESKREKEIKLANTLRPGTWNKVQFTIAPAKAEAFGMLGISITTNQVSLAGGR